MYAKIEGNLRMPYHQVMARFPGKFILTVAESMDDEIVTVLYIGDDRDELYELRKQYPELVASIIDSRGYGMLDLGGPWEIGEIIYDDLLKKQ